MNYKIVPTLCPNIHSYTNLLMYRYISVPYTPPLDQNPKMYRIPPKQLCRKYGSKSFFTAMHCWIVMQIMELLNTCNSAPKWLEFASFTIIFERRNTFGSPTFISAVCQYVLIPTLVWLFVYRFHHHWLVNVEKTAASTRYTRKFFL